jgi:hypothetical protein
MWSGGSSMGKGGGRLVCEIIRSCPLLKNIAILPEFYIRCKEPILEALASSPHITDFVVSNNRYSNQRMFVWRADEVVSRLFSKWESLETIELTDLSGRPATTIETVHKSIPVLNCALRTIILKRPDLDEREFLWILKGSIESLRTLHIISPTKKVDRAGLCRILAEYTAQDLESLLLDCLNWYSRSIEDVDKPTGYEGLLDDVFKSPSALRKLKCLSITGPLVGLNFFTSLPQSLKKLACSSCQISYPVFAKALSGHTDTQANFTPADEFNQRVHWLPNLKCCSMREDRVQSEFLFLLDF